MAHTVEVNIKSHPLSREENGIAFLVADNDGKFGELVVGKHGGAMLRMDGGLRWRPRGTHQPHLMTWAKLDRAMRDARKD